MIAVQSLWSTPARRTDGDLWLGSNHFLRRAGFDAVEIWADAEGEEWLRGLGLVYDRWHRLPDIEPELQGVWSIGKLIAAGAQEGPFLHVDGDAWWRRPPPDVPFIVQNAEPYSHSPAERWWREFGAAPCSMPPRPVCWNFGIFGGAEGKQIAEACREVTAFVRSNLALFARATCRKLPMLVEQVWVPALLAKRGIVPTPLLRADHLQEDARRLGYFHAMGGRKDGALMARVRATVKNIP